VLTDLPIYSIHESAPIVNGSSEEIETGRKHGTKFANKNAEQEVVVKKWAMMWRSIILSSVEGKTYLPYCRFIRSLNLRDLGNLFEDAKFKGELERSVESSPLTSDRNLTYHHAANSSLETYSNSTSAKTLHTELNKPRRRRIDRIKSSTLSLL